MSSADCTVVAKRSAPFFNDSMEEKKKAGTNFFARVFPTDSASTSDWFIASNALFDSLRRYSGFGFQGFSSKPFGSRCHSFRKSLNFQLSVQVHFAVRTFEDFRRNVVFTR